MNTKNAELFRQFKAKHPDAILLFRCPKTYQIFNEDAVDAAKILGLNISVRLTANPKKFKDQINKQCSFPHNWLDVYLPQLIRAGRRVAICSKEPLEPAPKATGYYPTIF